MSVGRLIGTPELDVRLEPHPASLGPASSPGGIDAVRCASCDRSSSPPILGLRSPSPGSHSKRQSVVAKSSARWP